MSTLWYFSPRPAWLYPNVLVLPDHDLAAGLRYSSHTARSGLGLARVVRRFVWPRHTNGMLSTTPLDPCARGTSAQRGNTRREGAPGAQVRPALVLVLVRVREQLRLLEQLQSRRALSTFGNHPTLKSSFLKVSSWNIQPAPPPGKGRSRTAKSTPGRGVA